LRDNAREITDLNNSTFEEVAPPKWAKQW